MRKLSPILILIFVLSFIPIVSATASLSIGTITYDSTVVKEESITVESSVTASSVSGTLTIDVTLTDNSGLFTVPSPTQQVQFNTDGTKAVSWTITAASAGNDATPFTIMASGDDGSSASKTSSTAVTVQDRPVLTVTSSTSKSSVAAGDTATISYIVSNAASAGAADATNVEITLLRPSGWSLSSGSSTYSLGTITPQASTSGSWVVKADNPSSSNTFTLRVTSTIPGGTVSGAASISGPSGGNGGSGGGGGGGGGGGLSGENNTNIEMKEKYDLYIFKDTVTSYRFMDKRNPILFINITGNANAGEINTAVEVLKNTSTLVGTKAPGIVYKNINIWVGSSGFAVPKNIKEATIEFRVENSWISENNLERSSVKLVRWDGSTWIQLETSEKNRDSNYTYYLGKTDSFSGFAIAGLKDVIIPTATSAGKGMKAADELDEIPGPAATKRRISGFEALLTVITISAGYRMRRRKE